MGDESQCSVRTTCPYCGVGCGVLVSPSIDGLSANVIGDTEHPANLGRLCSKGSALGETLDLDERLLHPQMNGKRVNWDKALGAVADGFAQTIREHGPDSVAFYVSGQILTEDYYIANKLMKGFIGSANIDTNSRLCMASSVVGHKRAFGADTVPGSYKDLEAADLIVMVGSNFAWCHPVLHQRVLAAKAERGTKLVVIDPRETATTAAADLHLPIKPGADVALYNWLLWKLDCAGATDKQFVENHTNGLQDTLISSCEIDDGKVVELTGIDRCTLERFFDLVLQTERQVTIYSQGVNQSTSGSDKVNAILNTHLLTGRIGKVGMGPFSITGQPNAMGGREVGGLANQLAAHMDFKPEDVDRIQRFWHSPQIPKEPGLKAVDLFEAVHSGDVKAIWIMATNPVVSLPKSNRVREALEICPLVVVSDIVSTSDTVKLADIALPATGWGEKDGTVTNSERRISRQRAFLPPPGEARHDWQTLCDVARLMGYEGFDFDNAAAIYREHAALSAFENEGSRDFDLSAHLELDDHAYDMLKPFQWPLQSTDVEQRGTRADDGDHRFFADGQFFTADRRARFIKTPFKAPQKRTSQHRPLILNTGRVRDHWHTMTRTGKTSRLSNHLAEPFLEVHPKDAETYKLEQASLVEVASLHGTAVLRTLITERVQPGQVFAPIHWTDRYTSAGRVDALVGPENDPASGQPDSKFTPVRIKPLKTKWYGYGVFQNEPSEPVLDALDYWALARIEAGWQVEFSGSLSASAWLDLTISGDDLVDLAWSGGGVRRCRFSGSDLTGAVYISPDGPIEIDRGWISSQLGKTHEISARFGLLAGRSASGETAGSIICSCHGVGSVAIQSAIEAGAQTINAIGQATCAGTNCGSCKPELESFLQKSIRTATLAAE